MGAIVYPNEGEVVLLDLITTNMPTINLRLYKSNTTPTQATVLADLTEADFGGYAAIPITTDFGAAATVNNKAQSDGTEQTFTADGASSNTVYGYYVDDGTKCILARRFDAPQVMASNGDQIKITIKLTLNSEN